MTETITIPIAGMSCTTCVDAVRTALDAVPGVQSSRVKVGSATVSYDRDRTSPFDLVRAISATGFVPVAANTAAYAGQGRRTCCGGEET